LARAVESGLSEAWSVISAIAPPMIASKTTAANPRAYRPPRGARGGGGGARRPDLGGLTVERNCDTRASASHLPSVILPGASTLQTIRPSQNEDLQGEFHQSCRKVVVTARAERASGRGP